MEARSRLEIKVESKAKLQEKAQEIRVGEPLLLVEAFGRY